MGEEKYRETLVIFDADFLLYYCTMGNKVFDEAGNPVKKDNKFVYTDKTLREVFTAADQIIQSLLDVVNTNWYIGYVGNGKCFRYNIDPEYKANRKDSIKPKWFKELKQYLVDKWKFILLNNGLEADDAVNIIRNRLQFQFKTFIVTTDKDLIKCIKGSYINAKDCSIIETSSKEAHLAFWTSMITGDSADNIKGLPGSGIAFAKKLFKDQDPHRYSDLVKEAYSIKYGKEQGHIECMKNFKLLFILDMEDELETPELNWVFRNRKESISESKESGNTGERDSNIEDNW